jgi:hypothetical protein
MNELLTPEDKKYLDRISRYVQSMGEKHVELDIEANDYDNQSEISDIDWDTITHFDWQRRLDIPSGFIEILQKIFNYIDQSGQYSFPDIEGINYNRFSIEINTINRELTVKQYYSYYAEGGEGELEFEEPELMEQWKDQLETNGIQIPEDGVLSVYYSGGGDDGSLDGDFSENNRQVPGNMEDFCYNQLSSNYGGWENNEGGQGRFEFNFNNGTIFLYHSENFEEQESNTLFEAEY